MTSSKRLARSRLWNTAPAERQPRTNPESSVQRIARPVDDMGMPPRSVVTLVTASWLSLCSAGLWQLGEHATSAGSAGSPPRILPAGVADGLSWSGDRTLLVLIAHPQCPCLAASLDELQAVLDAAPDTALRILVFEPTRRPKSWEPTASSTLFGDLPAGTVILDQDGELARSLGATTSGHVSMYAQNGRLAFAGGITGSRGHRGDNESRRALQRALRTTNSPQRSRSQPTTPRPTPVYGCPFDTPCDCNE